MKKNSEMIRQGDRNAPGNSGHYFGEVQPIDFFKYNVLESLLANIVKYVFRYKNKNGKLDLEKSLWYLDNYVLYLDNIDNEDANPICAGDLISSHRELSAEQKEVILNVEDLLVSKVFDYNGWLRRVENIRNSITALLKKEYCKEALEEENSVTMPVKNGGIKKQKEKIENENVESYTIWNKLRDLAYANSTVNAQFYNGELIEVIEEHSCFKEIVKERDNARREICHEWKVYSDEQEDWDFEVSEKEYAKERGWLYLFEKEEQK